MQIKAIIIFHCTRRAKIVMHWQGYGSIGALSYCCWECILENCLVVSINIKAKYIPTIDTTKYLSKRNDASTERHVLLLLSRFSRVRLCATPETTAHQAPPSLGFSRQEHWSGLPFPSPKTCARMFKAALLSSSLLLKLIKHAQGREAINFPCCPRAGVGVTEFRFCLEEKCKFLCTWIFIR